MYLTAEPFLPPRETHADAPNSNARSGPYTVARTYHTAGIFQLDIHLERLCRLMIFTIDDPDPRLLTACSTIVSSALGLADQAGGGLALSPELRRYLEGRLGVFEQIRTSYAHALVAFRRAYPSLEGHERRITTLLNWDEGQGDGDHVVEPPARLSLYHLVEPLPRPPAPPVTLLMLPREEGDAYAGLKDTAWIKDREQRYYGAKREAQAEELALVHADGTVPEGSQTNLYVVEQGTLVTAEEGVLKGTMRAAVLRACAEAGIPVRLEAPRLSRWRHWEALFISSTTRTVLPVDRLQLDPRLLDSSLGADRTQCISFEASPLVSQIQQAVLAHMAEETTEVERLVDRV